MYYSPFSSIFWFILYIVFPVWLIILTKRTSRLRRDMEELRQRGAVPGKVSLLERKDEREKTEAEDESFRMALPRSERKEGEGPQRSLEERIGGHWFQWLGIGALVIALVFFLRWSFENGLIGPTGRIVIGFLVAGGAIIAGDRLRGKYGVWALTFTGGGALASYITTWMALHMYQMFPSELAFIIYVLTTAVVCLLAGYYNAPLLAYFGIVGGFVTPILTGGGGSVTSLLFYILILDVGVLALSHIRSWRELNALTFLGTIFWEGYGFVSSFDYGISGDGIARDEAFLFLAAFCAIYLLVPAMFNILRKLQAQSGDILVLVGNALCHFALILLWLAQTPGLREMYDAPLALGCAALFIIFSFAVYMKNAKDTPLVISRLGLTVFFASLAIPLQLGEAWTSLAWSIEAAFLLWVSVQLKDKRVQLFAWPVMIFAYVWYLIGPMDTGSFAPVFMPSGFFLFLFWALLFMTLVWTAVDWDRESRQFLLPFALLGFAFLVIALSLNVFDYASSRLDRMGRFIEAAALIGGSYFALWRALRSWPGLSDQEKGGFTLLGIGVQIVTIAYLTSEFLIAIDDKLLFAGTERPWQIQQVGTSIIWAVYGALTLVVGLMKQWKPLRLFGIMLLLIVVLKLTLVDLFNLGTAARVTGFTVLGLLLTGSSFLYQRYKDSIRSIFADTSSSTK